MGDEIRRLNWGAGSIIRAGWFGSDRDDYGQEHVGDLLAGLPWPDEFFQSVVCNHSLQQIGYHDLVPALTELRRVTAPGGTIRILSPDLMRMIRAFRSADAEFFVIGDEVEPTLEGKLCTYLTWFSTARSVFTIPTLAEWLLRSGWSHPVLSDFGASELSDDPRICELDDREPESMIVEARA